MLCILNIGSEDCLQTWDCPAPALPGRPGKHYYMVVSIAKPMIVFTLVFIINVSLIQVCIGKWEHRFP